MKKRYIFLIFLVVLLSLFVVQLYISSPYTNTSFPNPFVARLSGGALTLSQKQTVHVVNNPLISFYRFFQGGVLIILASFNTEKSFSGSNKYIISQIHNERFDTTKPYVISGGHYSEFYLRNIGIFYSAILDGCISSSQEDWQKREITTVQSLALELALLQQVRREPTTFYPLWPNIYVPVNVFTRASDSLYAAIYTLSAMQNSTTTEWMYQDTSSCHALQTQKVAQQLLKQNRSNLVRLLIQYEKDIFDSKTGLIKTSVTLSSARDGIKRQSSFYDNVIAWATLRLARNLDLVSLPDEYFENWKQKIIATFWDEQDGLFINDLSSDSKIHHTFSADEFIVLQTQFFTTHNTEDKRKLKKMIVYVHQQKFDAPFPLRYAKKDDYTRMYFWTWLAVPMYMGESIWSHWGMEYIKALILTGNITQAQKFVDIYAANIQKYGGYPEVYNLNGHPLHARMYTSILRTGWVVNFEEVQRMLTQHAL